MPYYYFSSNNDQGYYILPNGQKIITLNKPNSMMYQFLYKVTMKEVFNELLVKDDCYDDDEDDEDSDIIFSLFINIIKN